MSKVTINYSDIRTASRRAKSVSNYYEDFEEDLTKIEIEKALSSVKKLNSIITELKTTKKKVEDLEAYFD